MSPLVCWQPMTDEFRQLLLARRSQLEALRDSANEAAAPVPLDQTRVGRLSRMDAMQQQAMAQAAVRRQDEELRRITAALARLERDDFGRCESCDEPIAPARLRLDPTVTCCINCAE